MFQERGCGLLIILFSHWHSQSNLIRNIAAHIEKMFKFTKKEKTTVMLKLNGQQDSICIYPQTTTGQ